MAYAPRRHAGADRRQPTPVAGGAGTEAGGCYSPWTTPPALVAQAVFRTSEDTRGYLVLLEGLVRQWGIRLALYSDRHAAFKYNARQKPDPQVETTQFARVIRELGINQDITPSPTPGQRKSGADDGDLPGQAGNRATPGRRQHHWRGRRGPPRVLTSVQRAVRRR